MCTVICCRCCQRVTQSHSTTHTLHRLNMVLKSCDCVEKRHNRYFHYNLCFIVTGIIRRRHWRWQNLKGKGQNWFTKPPWLQLLCGHMTAMKMEKGIYDGIFCVHYLYHVKGRSNRAKTSSVGWLYTTWILWLIKWIGCNSGQEYGCQLSEYNSQQR